MSDGREYSPLFALARYCIRKCWKHLPPLQCSRQLPLRRMLFSERDIPVDQCVCLTLKQQCQQPQHHAVTSLDDVTSLYTTVCSVQSHVLTSLNDVTSLYTTVCSLQQPHVLNRCELYADNDKTSPDLLSRCDINTTHTATADNILTADVDSTINAQLHVSITTGHISTTSQLDIPHSSAVDLQSKKRIEELEREIAGLRERLAAIELNPAGHPTQQCAWSSAPGGPPLPPPLPPPPPPILPTLAMPNVCQLIRQKREKNRERLGISGTGVNALPNMTEVLRGIGSVTLKKTPRSPGGTPLRTKPMEREDLNDTASVIGRALRKKFSTHVLMNSPDRPDRSSPGSDSTSEWAASDSPCRAVSIAGPHLLKPAANRRKSHISPLSTVLE